MEYRTCSKCGKNLPKTKEFFGGNQSSNFEKKTFLRPECKECTKKCKQGQTKAYKLAGKPKHPEIGTPCDLCTRTDMELVFDHDHKTLEHRGWLCQNCNQGLGRLGDNEEGLQKALNYLIKSKNP